MANQTTLRAEAVEELIEKYMTQLQQGASKATVSDLLRLIELQKEISAGDEAGEGKEITVQWVEPAEETRLSG